MAKDLVAQYGAGTGPSVTKLRKALKVRNTVIGVVGLAVLALFGGLYLIDPIVPVILLGAILGVGAVAGAVSGLMWMIDELPTHLDVIRRAKYNGVMDDE